MTNPNQMSSEQAAARASKLLKESEERIAAAKAVRRKVLASVLEEAHSSPKTLHAFRMSLAEEMVADWYRRSLLAKVMSSEDVDKFHVSLLAWAKNAFLNFSIPDKVEVLEDLMMRLTASATYTDNYLIKAIDETYCADTQAIPNDMFASSFQMAFSTFLPKGKNPDIAYLIMNGAAWTPLITTETLEEYVKPVVKHEMLTLGILGELSKPSSRIVWRESEEESTGSIQIISDAFCTIEGQSISRAFKTPTFFFLRGSIVLKEPIEITGSRIDDEYVYPELRINLSDSLEGIVARKITLQR